MGNDFVHVMTGKIDRDGKSNPLASATSRQNRSIDSDQLSLGIDQGAAGVSRINGRIGLDEVLIVLDAQMRAAFGADDSHGHRLADAERISNGKHKVAHLHFGGISQRNGWKIVRVNFEYGDIGLGVCTDDVRLEFALIT